MYFTLEGEEARHAVKVLRHKKGDLICASDGTGWSLEAEVVTVSSSLLTARIVKKEEWKNEPKTQIALAVGLTKGEKLDWLVEKATEAGVAMIHPFFARFSEIAWNREQMAKNTLRWRRIATAAFKQCRRSVIPGIEVLSSLAEVIDKGKEGDLFAAHPALESVPVIGNMGNRQKIMGVVGPEGGFSPDEVSSLKSAGARLISLGSRRLRTETAGLVLLAQILTVKAEL